ncbi:MAG: 3-hydroxyisobutyrate dehydrogenase [Alphaproteobacteria bacterium]|nr:3-hydroxyisobutyrate dehydrogenase [Alphaproteobacteria bacterium SS10]
MTKIAFIGLGNMGLPMAKNLLAAGHELIGFDLSADNLAALEQAGGQTASDAATAAGAAEVVITMLPAGDHVTEVFLGDGKAMKACQPGTLLIDCSTIDVATARAIAGAAETAGLAMIDAPVSGGVGGAEAGTLTFMVGGSDEAVAKAQPLLDVMGGKTVHTGGPGNGQAAKICNNMMLGIQMLSVCEAFALADKLGLDPQKLFDVASTSSGQCWSLTTYCPFPGLLENTPSSREYAPGFTSDMMLKDLRLAQQAAAGSGAATPLGAETTALYAMHVNGGNGALDFSSILKMLRGA